ncbi:unnamed protein product, partial [Meganyctiphanes norvegica]
MLNILILIIYPVAMANKRILLNSSSDDSEMFYTTETYNPDSKWLSHSNLSMIGVRNLPDISNHVIYRNNFEEQANTSENYEGNTAISNSSWCGFRDDMYPFLHNATSGKRNKRYTLQGNKWKHKDLTWTLRKGPSNQRLLDTNKIRSIMIKAFKLWQVNSGLTFQEVHASSTNVDIYVDFATYDHDDPYPFDGKGQTLAHAFYPGSGAISGDVHFDDHEQFALHSERDHDKVSLYFTAAHSDDNTALMAPFYQNFEEGFTLPEDDRIAIQALYGPAVVQPITYPPRTYPPRTYPPRTYPPRTYPPRTYPPRTNPPRTHPPRTNPPRTHPPRTHPPRPSTS